jgi:hypothetical protein
LIGFVAGLVLITLPFLSYVPDWVNSGASAYDLNTSDGGCFRLVSITAMIQCFLPAGWPQIGAVSLMVMIGLGLTLPHFWQNRDPASPIFDRHLALTLVMILLLLDNVRIADQMLFTLPLLVIWRDWHVIEGLWLRRLAIGLLMAIYVIPYAVDLLQANNIAFILPLWYLGLSLAVIGLLFLQMRPPLPKTF